MKRSAESNKQTSNRSTYSGRQSTLGPPDPRNSQSACCANPANCYYSKVDPTIFWYGTPTRGGKTHYDPWKYLKDGKWISVSDDEQKKIRDEWAAFEEKLSTEDENLTERDLRRADFYREHGLPLLQFGHLQSALTNANKDQQDSIAATLACALHDAGFLKVDS
ncbi:MAG: hypothetical protein U0350_12560 [Caldilineaceae bacterium]